MHISKRFRPSRGDSENNMKDVFETNENAHEKWMRKSKIVMRVCLSCERADQQGRMEKAETLQIKILPHEMFAKDTSLRDYLNRYIQL